MRVSRLNASVQASSIERWLWPTDVPSHRRQSHCSARPRVLWPASTHIKQRRWPKLAIFSLSLPSRHPLMMARHRHTTGSLTVPKTGRRRKHSIAQTLPFDILVIVFAMAVAADAQLPDFREPRDGVRKAHAAVRALPNMFSRRSAPRNISQVCQDWRAVVEGAPQLWATIAMHEPAVTLYDDDDVETMTLKIKNRLKLTGEAPLTLSGAVGYGFGDPQLDWGDRYISRMFQQFLELANNLEERRRWKRVSFLSFISPINHSNLVFRDFPLLEELSLRFPVVVDINYNGPTQVDVSSCTKLTTLKLDGDFDVLTNGTILEDLTHIEIFRHERSLYTDWGSITIVNALQLVQLAPSLVTLKLDVYPMGNTEVEIIGDIWLPHLSELTLRTVDKDEAVVSQVGELLDVLILPSLTNLELELAPEMDVIALIERSECSITTLDVDGSRYFFAGDRYGRVEEFTPDELVAGWLSFMPKLQSLSMYKVDMTEYLVECLTLFSSEEDDVLEAFRALPFFEDFADDSNLDGLGEIEADVVGGSVQASTVAGNDLDLGVEDDDDDNLCRSLKRMSLHLCEYNERVTPEIVGKFIDMLHSRLRDVEMSVGEMEAFYSLDCDMDDVMDDKAIQKWIKDGVDLVFC